MKAVTVQLRRSFDDREGRYWQSEPEAHCVFFEQPIPCNEVADWMLHMLEEHYPVITRRRRRLEAGDKTEVLELRDDEHTGDEVYFRFRFPEGNWHHFVMYSSVYIDNVRPEVYVKELDRPPHWVLEEPKVLMTYDYRRPQSA